MKKGTPFNDIAKKLSKKLIVFGSCFYDIKSDDRAINEVANYKLWA